MLIRHCLRILGVLAAKFDLRLSVVFMSSESNRMDILTRLKKSWLQVLEELEQGMADVYQLSELKLRRLKTMHFMGVYRTLSLTRKVDSDGIRQSVQKVVGICNRYQSVNPTLVVHEAGSISVEHN